MKLTTKCFALLLTLLSSPLFAQETEEADPMDLDSQYERLMKKSTSYKDYKVVKKVGLNELWENINDSLDQSRSNHEKALTKIDDLNKELKATNDSLSTTSSSLEESNFSRDRISFLGIPLLKVTYNTIVWGIILLLAGLAVILFLRFAKSNATTKSTKKEYNSLEDEFEEYKKKARESEINLKRELQTAINTIEDLKR